MRVIAVEPMAENVRYLERHIRLNRIQNVEVLGGSGWKRVWAGVVCPGDNRSTGHLGTGPLRSM